MTIARGRMVTERGRSEDDDVLVLPPLPADPVFIEAVDEAVAGPAWLPEAQPERRLGADTRDFASLYLRHRSSFALHAGRFLSDSRDVDEVLQEAFLRLFLALPELETELQALSYCRRTVTNLCIDRYRADQRRPRLLDLDALPMELSDDAADDDPVLRAEDAAIVREALALLSPMHRAALIKREIEEKPLAQIATELDIPEESVKHLLYRARRALRRLLVGTTVEPGVDLTNGEMLRIANKRLACATLRSANVLIVLIVTVVAVAGMLARSSVGRGDVAPAPVGAGALPALDRLPVAVPRQAKPGARRSARIPTDHDNRGPSTATGASEPAAPAASGTASRHEQWTTPHRPDHQTDGKLPVPVPVHTPGSGGSTPPPPAGGGTPGTPAFAIEGAYAPAGTASVTATSTVHAGAGTVAVTRFSAPTSEGVLQIDQTVTATGSTSVALDPALITTDDAVLQMQLGQVVVEQTPNADGTLALTIFASVDSVVPAAGQVQPGQQPQPAATAPATPWSGVAAQPAITGVIGPSSSGPGPAPVAASSTPTPSALTLSLVLSADRTRVLFEHVAVAS